MTEEISNALQKAAAECRAVAGMPITDVGHYPNSTETEEHKDRVTEICDELASLAQQALKRRVSLSEYDALRHKLAALGSHPAGETFRKIQQAFVKQGPPYS